MTVATQDTREQAVPVWDPLVRIVHWSVAILFLVNFALIEEGDLVHRLAGYAVLTLVSLRLAWGLIGTEHARFSAFPPSISGALAHLREALAGREETHLSHNPLGALMAYALWALLIAIALSGMALHAGLIPEEAGEEIHEILANLAFAAVLLHIAGVVLESLRSGVNLVRAMVTGDKIMRERGRR